MLLADPCYGKMLSLKCDVVPKLTVAFSGSIGDDPLIVLPRVLLMGRKNSGPAFCTATKTVADVANTLITTNMPQPIHYLYNEAKAMDYNVKPAPSIPQQYLLTNNNIIYNLLLKQPCPKRLAYVDVFLNDFISLAQGNQN